MKDCAIAGPPVRATDDPALQYAFTEQYLYDSLVHIPSTTFAVNKSKPIWTPTEALDAETERRTREKSDFVEGDFERLRLLYGCPSECFA